MIIAMFSGLAVITKSVKDKNRRNNICSIYKQGKQNCLKQA